MALEQDGTRRTRRERGILRATLEELASADYGGLSFENVAKRAGVNKTTLYRRWPSKADLVGSAIATLADEMILAPTSGSLRADLLEIGRRMLNLALSLEGQGLVRLCLCRPEPELAALVAMLQAKREESLERLLAAAVERGELAKKADLSLLLEMLAGMMHVRLFVKNEPVDELLITRAVDVLLHGALVPIRAARSKPRRRVRRNQ